MNVLNKISVIGFIICFFAGLSIAANPNSGKKSTMTDSRDGKMYKTVKIGDQTWMAENLNYEDNNSKCYDNDDVNCQKYGRLYKWKAALSACPENWHIPSVDEWKTLLNIALENVNTNTGTIYLKENVAESLRARRGWENKGTDVFGFSALPAGFGDYDTFRDIGNVTNFWSSADMGGYVYAFIGRSFGITNDGGSGNVMSVRCIQNTAEYGNEQEKVLMALNEQQRISDSLVDAELKRTQQKIDSLKEESRRRSYVEDSILKEKQKREQLRADSIAKDPNSIVNINKRRADSTFEASIKKFVDRQYKKFFRKSPEVQEKTVVTLTFTTKLSQRHRQPYDVAVSITYSGDRDFVNRWFGNPKNWTPIESYDNSRKTVVVKLIFGDESGSKNGRNVSENGLVVEGNARSIASVEKFIKQHSYELDQVYEQFYNRIKERRSSRYGKEEWDSYKKDFTGKFCLKFKITPKGKVKFGFFGLGSIETSTGSTNLDNKLKETVEQWNFGNINSDDDVSVTMPYTLKKK